MRVLAPLGLETASLRPHRKAMLDADKLKMCMGTALKTLPCCKQQKKKPKKGNFSSIFCYFFGRFSIYLAPSGAKYREKRPKNS